MESPRRNLLIVLPLHMVQGDARQLITSKERNVA